MLELIVNKGPISRAEIAKQMAMSPTSASRIVASLLDEELIKEVHLSQGEEVGRKATYFVPNEHAVFSVGVEIDIGIIRVGLMNLVGDLFVDHSFKTETDEIEKVVEFIERTVSNLILEANISSDRVIGVCVGLPGLIDNELGIVELSAQFNWKQVSLQQMIADKLPYNIYIDNELKLKALAEYVSTSLSYENVVMIGFGNGVGSALITNGEIYRGKDNVSGEIGHMTLDPYGVHCTCGNFGCLQTYIAVDFLLDEASRTRPIKNMDELVESYKQGDRLAVNIIEKAATYAAIAINNVVCAYNPDAVFLSGCLIEDYPEIRALVIEKHLNSTSFPEARSFELQVTQLKGNGVVQGAALSVQRKFIKNLYFKDGA
ncbi:ROK family protein [Pseudogracilibacillus auburnensis]|nr:ROK family transcriptional regulator [Pseudogracilibacillus auburnensis]